MKKTLMSATLLTIGLLVAPMAHADEFDFTNDLDTNGIYYDSILDMIDLGKKTCSQLRRGNSVGAVQQSLAAAGYPGIEGSIIIRAATANMCPDAG